LFQALLREVLWEIAPKFGSAPKRVPKFANSCSPEVLAASREQCFANFEPFRAIPRSGAIPKVLPRAIPEQHR
jgi:hypothetical protein